MGRGISGSLNENEEHRFKCVICGGWTNGKHAPDVAPGFQLSGLYCREHWEEAGRAGDVQRARFWEAVQQLRADLAKQAREVREESRGLARALEDEQF